VSSIVHVVPSVAMETRLTAATGQESWVNLGITQGILRDGDSQEAGGMSSRSDQLVTGAPVTLPSSPEGRGKSSGGLLFGLRDQASHLVRFLATGGDSPAVRAELRVIETTLEGLRSEWATIEKASALPPPRVHPAWVMTKLERLDALLRRDPQRAKLPEIGPLG
jgi:hypothetical protein